MGGSRRGIGLDLAYLDISFPYDPPESPDTQANRERIQLSGYGGFMSVSYRF